jgi:PKD repeat protein
MQKGLLLLAAFAVSLFVSSTSLAQHYCGQAIFENEQRAADPILDQLVRNQDSILFSIAAESGNSSRSEKRIIPVVFHIIHLNGDENINDDQIHDAIRIMNEDFSAINAELDDVIPFFQDRIGNTNIELRLATIDPNGNPTTGIDRIESAQTNVGLESSKLNTWNRNNYYNIWVTNVIGLGGAAAYAIRPSNNPAASRDGVISNHRYVGSIGTASLSGSKTLTHETAHYLNVIHTWGESNTPGLANNCNMDDGVLDTPNTLGTGNGSCNLNQNTCNSLDNVQNFMDYASCESMFTEGQVNVMRTALNFFAIRNNLWTQGNLEATGTSGIQEARYFVASNVACRGEAVQFFDESRYDATSWNWELIGPQTLTSTEKNPVFTFDVAGVYTVKLTVSDGNVSKTIEDEKAFVVSDVYGFGMPFRERFVNPKNGWAVDMNESYDEFTWEQSNAGYQDEASYRVLNFANETKNNKDLIFSGLDFRGMTSVDIDFRIAYRQLSPSNNDQLRVELSNDCGASWRTIEIINSTQLAAGKGLSSSPYTPESDSEWEKFTINNVPLTWLDEQTSIKFKFIPGGGNHLYIDDINIDGDYEEVPYLVYPDNGAPSMNQDVVLDWRSVPGSDAYELEISDVSDFSNVVESVRLDAIGSFSDGSDTEYKATVLEKGVKYYWRVRADDNGNLSDWSADWTFTVAADGVGMNDQVDQNEFLVYPNPSNGSLHVIIPRASTEGVMEIFNANGQLVFTKNFSSTDKSEQHIALHHLPDGIYILKLTASAGNWNKRFVISR